MMPLKSKIRHAGALAAMLGFVLAVPAQCGGVRTGDCPRGQHVVVHAMSFTCKRN